MPNVNHLMKRIKEFQDDRLIGIDLIITWLNWQIQPLQAREHPMWAYTDVSDCTRGPAAELSNKVFMILMKNLTKECNGLNRMPHMAPYSAGNPPPDVSTFVLRVKFLCCLVHCLESESFIL